MAEHDGSLHISSGNPSGAEGMMRHDEGHGGVGGERGPGSMMPHGTAKVLTQSPASEGFQIGIELCKELA